MALPRSGRFTDLTWARGDVGSEFAVIKCVEPAVLATEQDLFHVLGRVFLFEVSLVSAGLDGLVVAVGTLVLPLTSVPHPVAPESVVIAGLEIAVGASEPLLSCVVAGVEGQI